MFDQKASEHLGYYVYMLFDPLESQEPFYVGKGKGNRVFDHAVGAIHEDDSDVTDDRLGEAALSPCLDRVEQINRRGDKVERIIVAHGLSEEEADALEA